MRFPCVRRGEFNGGLVHQPQVRRVITMSLYALPVTSSEASGHQCTRCDSYIDDLLASALSTSQVAMGVSALGTSGLLSGLVQRPSTAE